MNGASPSQPSICALIVGVSDYPKLIADETVATPSHHFGLRPLSSAAKAAHRIYEWLTSQATTLSLPLGSCQLLLSPSQQELQSGVPSHHPRATFDNFNAAAEQWRAAARSHPGNMALFYFAGHGLMRLKSEQSQVLLMEGFGGTPTKKLRHGVEATNLFTGMAPESADDLMARWQIYFLDACRSLPREAAQFEELEAEKLWDIPIASDSYHDNRIVPIFYTAEPGATAFGIKGEGTVFGEALLRCLNGGAGRFDQSTGRWQVTVRSLTSALPDYLDIVCEEFGVQQTLRMANIGPNTTLRTLSGPPLVDVQITVSEHASPDAAEVSVSNDRSKRMFSIPPPFPAKHTCKIGAGSYIIEAPAPNQFHRIFNAAPPKSHWPVQFD